MFKPVNRTCALVLAVIGFGLVSGFQNSARGQSAEWISGISGSWSDANDWSSYPYYPDNSNPPGSLYTVSIPDGAPSITLGVNPTIDGLSMAGGAIVPESASTPGTLAVNGVFNWSGGEVGDGLNDQITVNVGGVNFNGMNEFLFDGATLNSSGTSTWKSGSISTGNSGGEGAAIFNNLAGANFNVTIPGNGTYGGNGSTAGNPDVFNNAGTFTESPETGTTIITSEFNNTGQVNVQNGTLYLDGGGSATGDFTISGGAVLELYEQGTFSFTGSSIGGSGTVQFIGGTNNFNTGSGDSAGNTAIGIAAVVNFNTGQTDSLVALALSGGTLAGSDTITTSGTFTWTGGTFGSGTNTQTLTANGGISFSGSPVLSPEATINNSATANWTSGNIEAQGNNKSGQNTTFNNLSGANFNLQGNNTYDGRGSTSTVPDVFNNAGTFTKSVGTGTTTMETEFNNSGQVNVQTGTLSLTGGGSQSGGFTVSGGAALNLSGGHTFTATSTLGGAGAVNFTGGTSVFNMGATLDPTGPVAITGGTVQIHSVQTLASLSISATLDLTNTHLFIDYGSGSDPISSIAGYIKSGYNGGNWNGPGIISSNAQSLTNGLHYGVGFADGADKIVSGLPSGEIELKYTLLGDANLDGTVNGSDFSILAANFGKGVTNWDQGNFLFSSSVNGSDFSALATNFGQGDSSADTSVSTADITALDAFAIANGLPLPMIGAVPEPACLGLFAMAGLGALARRRRR